MGGCSFSEAMRLQAYYMVWPKSGFWLTTSLLLWDTMTSFLKKMAKAFGIRIQLKYNIHFHVLEWNLVIHERCIAFCCSFHHMRIIKYGSTLCMTMTASSSDMRQTVSFTRWVSGSSCHTNSVKGIAAAFFEADDRGFPKWIAGVSATFMYHSFTKWGLFSFT